MEVSFSWDDDDRRSVPNGMIDYDSLNLAFEVSLYKFGLKSEFDDFAAKKPMNLWHFFGAFFNRHLLGSTFVICVLSLVCEIGQKPNSFH